MSHSGGFGRLVLLLVIATVCLDSLADVLPRLVVPAVVFVALAVALRLTFFHTRRW